MERVHDVIDWVNRNEGALSVVLTVCIVVLTAILLRYTHRSDENAKRMLRSAELQRLNSSLPVINVAIDSGELEWHDRTMAAFPVRVLNAGSGPAIGPSFDWSTPYDAQLHFVEPTVVIGVGSTPVTAWISHKKVSLDILRSILYGPVVEADNQITPGADFLAGTLRVDYGDVHGRSHWSTFGIGYTANSPSGSGYRPIVLTSEIRLENV